MGADANSATARRRCLRQRQGGPAERPSSRRKRKRQRRLDQRARSQAESSRRGDRTSPSTEDFGKLAGGYGGGVRRYGRKTTVEECMAVAASQWVTMPPAGILRWKDSSISYACDRDFSLLRLAYTATNCRTKHQESLDYSIRVTTTQPRFGGLRWWFLCPLITNGVPCGRRVGKLYLPAQDRYFGCRHCHRLTYTSCQSSRGARQR